LPSFRLSSVSVDLLRPQPVLRFDWVISALAATGAPNRNPRSALLQLKLVADPVSPVFLAQAGSHGRSFRITNKKARSGELRTVQGGPPDSFMSHALTFWLLATGWGSLFPLSRIGCPLLAQSLTSKSISRPLFSTTLLSQLESIHHQQVRGRADQALRLPFGFYSVRLLLGCWRLSGSRVCTALSTVEHRGVRPHAFASPTRSDFSIYAPRPASTGCRCYANHFFLTL
jgi:hypothetical protein